MVEQEKLKIGDTVWSDIYDNDQPLECEVEYLHGGTTISIKVKDRPAHVTCNVTRVFYTKEEFIPSLSERSLKQKKPKAK